MCFSSRLRLQYARQVLLFMGEKTLMHSEAMVVMTVSMLFGVVAVLCISTVILLIFGGLIEPALKYNTSSTEALRNDSSQFLSVLEALTDSKANRGSRFEVLTNGGVFYEAQLAAIATAQKSVNLEAYIFDRGEIGRRYVEALAERARAGVQIRVVCDAFGSLGVNDAYFADLTRAGGVLAWYNGPRWYRLARINNRTHRELMIVDGRLGFIGGAGIADQWYRGRRLTPRWRDTVIKFEGGAVTHLQATFAGTWLEAHGGILPSQEFPEADNHSAEDSIAMIVNSTPSYGGASRARILFQTLIASSTKSIHITTPYFLPDSSLAGELVHAVKNRGIEVTILVPGKKSDLLLTRSASRRGYGPLLKAGARVCEYQPSMIHAKVLLIDGLWSVVGSTNFDQRSFGINNEVNMTVRGAAFTQRLEQDFIHDLADSRELVYDEWRKRSLIERIPEFFGWIIQQQQ
jgi:cardiolipin synthase